MYKRTKLSAWAELLDSTLSDGPTTNWPDYTGPGWLPVALQLAYERRQVSKRLPNDHPMRVPDDVFWTDERQELANDIAYAAVEDMTAADWWADQTPEQQRELVLEEERQQEEERRNGGHN